MPFSSTRHDFLTRQLSVCRDEAESEGGFAFSAALYTLLTAFTDTFYICRP
jgi:hypothetical protein